MNGALLLLPVAAASLVASLAAKAAAAVLCEVFLGGRYR